MSNSADFELRLRNRITSPANAARSSIDQIRNSFIDLDSGGTKAIRDVVKSIEGQAKAAAKAERQQASVAASAAKRNIDNYRLIENLRRKVERDRLMEVAKAQRAAEQKAKAEVKAANEVLKAQQRAERHAAKVSNLASGRARSDAAYLAHRKVLDGGVAAEINGAGGGGAGIAGMIGAAAPVAAVAAALAVVASAAVRAARAVAGIGLELASATLEAGDFAQRSRHLLGRLAGDAAAGSKAFDEVREQAVRLGLDVRDSIAQAQQLVGAGVELNVAKDAIAAGADLGTGSALAEVIERIADAGELGAKDLKALQKAGIAQTNMFDKLAKATGKSREELEKLIAAGEIKPDVAIGAAIQAAMAEVNSTRPGQVAAEQVKFSPSRMLEQVGARLEVMKQNAGEKINTALSPALNGLTTAFMNALDNPRLQAAGMRLLGHLERFGGWVVDHMPEIEQTMNKAADGIAVAIEGVNKVFEFFEKHPKAAEIALKAVGIAAGAVGLVIANLAAVAGTIALPFITFTGALATAGQIIQDVDGKLRELIPRFVNAGRDMIDGFVEGIRSRVNAAIDAVKGLASSVAQAFTGPKGIDAHSPSRLFKGFGEDSARGYALGLKESRRDINSAIAQVVPFAANDNAFASRAAPVAAPIAPMAQMLEPAAPGAAQAQAGGARPVVVHLALTNTFNAAPENPEQFGAQLGQAVERELKKVMGGI